MKRVIVFLLVAVMVLATAGCGGEDQEATSTGAETTENASSELTKDQILVVGMGSLPTGIDMEYHTSLEGLCIEANIFETLLKWPRKQNENGTWVYDFDYEKVTGALVEKWYRSDDQKTVYFKLKEGILSNYGNELTAEDVKWKLDRAEALNAVGHFHMYMPTGLSSSENVKVEDKYLLSITTDNPSYIMDLIFTHVITGIVDSTEAKKHTTKDDPWATEWLATNSATFGPYYLAEWSPGNQVVLLENPNYYGEKVAIKKIIFKEIPNTANRLAMLQSGDIDVFEWPLSEQVKQLEKADNVKVEYHRSNLSIRIEPDFKDELLSNKLVRQALAYAFPYDEVMSTVYQGMANKMSSVQAAIFPCFVDAYKYTTDTEKAKQLLAEAGYPNGIDMSISIDSSRTDHERLCILYQASLAKAGIRLTINKLPTGDLYSKRLAHELQLYVNQDMAGFPDPQFAIGIFVESSSGANYNSYLNERVDELFAQGAASMDEAVRTKCWEEMQEIFADDVGWIMVCEPGYYLPVTKALEGVTWNSLNGVDYRYATLTR